MLQRLADLSRLLQLGALQHHGESHHFAPSMLALGLKFWNTQHAIDWNLLFTISSLSLSPSHSGDLQSPFEKLKHSTFCWLKLTDSNSSFPPSHSGDLQPSDRHGSKVLGPVVHLPDWGFKIPFFQENLDKHFPRFHFFKKFLKNIFYVSTFSKIQPPIPPSPRSRRAWTRWWSPSGTWRNSRPASRCVGHDW